MVPVLGHLNPVYTLPQYFFNPACLVLVSFFSYSSTLEMKAICSSKKSVDFVGLRVVISQNTELVFKIRFNIVTDLLRAVLSNGSINKPQERLFSMGSAQRPLLCNG
jgi:hypothetical protein